MYFPKFEFSLSDGENWGMWPENSVNRLADTEILAVQTRTNVYSAVRDMARMHGVPLISHFLE